MWNYNDLIRLEVGKGIVSAASYKDKRNPIEIFYKKAPKQEAQLLIEEIGNIRARLNKYNIALPIISVTNNDSINYNEFKCYWGVTPFYYKISNLQELYDFIEETAMEYNVQDWSHNYVKSSLRSTVEDVKKGDLQSVYDVYQELYYIARVKGYRYESIQILSEISAMISTINIELATEYARMAMVMSRNTNIIDINLKCKACYNYASLLLAQDKAKDAYDNFKRCAYYASCNGNSMAQFFAFVGIAECFIVRQSYASAIDYYKQALSLLDIHNPQSSCMSNSIYRKMVPLYDVLLNSKDCAINQMKKYDIRTYLGGVITDILDILFTGLVKNMVYKMCKIQGNLAIFSFGSNYIVKDNAVFHGTIKVGNNINA